jgi:hypothetical protein
MTLQIDSGNNALYAREEQKYLSVNQRRQLMQHVPLAVMESIFLKLVDRLEETFTQLYTFVACRLQVRNPLSHQER